MLTSNLEGMEPSGAASFGGLSICRVMTEVTMPVAELFWPHARPSVGKPRIQSIRTGRGLGEHRARPRLMQMRKPRARERKALLTVTQLIPLAEVEPGVELRILSLNPLHTSVAPQSPGGAGGLLELLPTGEGMEKRDITTCSSPLPVNSLISF